MMIKVGVRDGRSTVGRVASVRIDVARPAWVSSSRIPWILERRSRPLDAATVVPDIRNDPEIVMRSKTHAAPPTTIDEYLARVRDDKRAALERLRATIRAVVPTAEECISYGMPAFRYEGRVLVYFAAAANHCAFYPGGMVNDLKDELEA